MAWLACRHYCPRTLISHWVTSGCVICLRVATFTLWVWLFCPASASFAVVLLAFYDSEISPTRLFFHRKRDVYFSHSRTTPLHLAIFLTWLLLHWGACTLFLLAQPLFPPTLISGDYVHTTSPPISLCSAFDLPALSWPGTVGGATLSFLCLSHSARGECMPIATQAYFSVSRRQCQAWPYLFLASQAAFIFSASAALSAPVPTCIALLLGQASALPIGPIMFQPSPPHQWSVPHSPSTIRTLETLYACIL